VAEVIIPDTTLHPDVAFAIRRAWRGGVRREGVDFAFALVEHPNLINIALARLESHPDDVVPGIDGFQLVLREVVSAIMHHRSIIVGATLAVVKRWVNFVEIIDSPLKNILIFDGNVIVAIRPRLLVFEPQRVNIFVLHSVLRDTPRGEVQLLTFSFNSPNIRPAAILIIRDGDVFRVAGHPLPNINDAHLVRKLLQRILNDSAVGGDKPRPSRAELVWDMEQTVAANIRAPKIGQIIDHLARRLRFGHDSLLGGFVGKILAEECPEVFVGSRLDAPLNQIQTSSCKRSQREKKENTQVAIMI